jgi:hypothetical protein
VGDPAPVGDGLAVPVGEIDEVGDCVGVGVTVGVPVLVADGVTGSVLLRPQLMIPLIAACCHTLYSLGQLANCRQEQQLRPSRPPTHILCTAPELERHTLHPPFFCLSFRSMWALTLAYLITLLLFPLLLCQVWRVGANPPPPLLVHSSSSSSLGLVFSSYPQTTRLVLTHTCSLCL